MCLASATDFPATSSVMMDADAMEIPQHSHLKPALRNYIVFDFNVDRQIVTAQRVHPFGACRSPGQFAVVSCVFYVIHDHIVV